MSNPDVKLLADRDERFRGLLIKVVLFFLLALAGLALGLVFSGVKKGLFSPKTPVFFIADNGQDIKEGMPVKLSGFKIGSVKHIELDNLARARVEMQIENNYFTLLDANTVISLRKESMLGDSILEVEAGRIRFHASPCRGQQCIHSGWLSRAGDFAACLPNRVSVALVSAGTRYDAISY